MARAMSVAGPAGPVMRGGRIVAVMSAKRPAMERSARWMWSRWSPHVLAPQKEGGTRWPFLTDRLGLWMPSSRPFQMPEVIR
jgi:hypothetical protein